MRFVLETISLHFISNVPAFFTWRKRKYKILNVQQTWRYRGEWWKHDEIREYMLLETNAGLFEIYKLSQKQSDSTRNAVTLPEAQRLSHEQRDSFFVSRIYD